MTTIAIASGKGGTGKTFAATNLARVLQQSGHRVTLVDCDVEAPNAHLFLNPEAVQEESVVLKSPQAVDPERCTFCGECARQCQFNAIAVLSDRVIFFPELCHVCDACTRVCPTDAVIQKDREIGTAIQGDSGGIALKYALLKTGEGGMGPRLIKKLRAHRGEGICIIDAPPGTTCPVVEAVRGVDQIVLVTDPTPFGVHDLKLAVDMCRELEMEPVVLINRADAAEGELREYCREEKLTVVGEIPDDREIARIYSRGEMLVEKRADYRQAFERIGKTVLQHAKRPKSPFTGTGKMKRSVTSIKGESAAQRPAQNPGKGREVVVISGKGGTGKTSLTACFCALARPQVTADCDVDAANLHLILQPVIRERGAFSGGLGARIDPERCTRCGECESACRFEAIHRVPADDGEIFQVDDTACEGCGVCRLVCPADAVKMDPVTNGEWYLSDTRMGPLSHARLGVAGENSGKLVTLVREKGRELLDPPEGRRQLLMDGAPGIGCPVIASLTGADFAVVVTEPTVSGVHDLERILGLTGHFGIPAGVVINKADLNPAQSERIHRIAGRREVKILGEIPYDPLFTRAQVEGLSRVEYADDHLHRILQRVWETIIGKLNQHQEKKNENSDPH